MSRVQLGLPLTVVVRLSEEEKSQLVVQQCTLLQIEEFEADALLKMCGATGKVSKGFGLVYRYAGLVDEIRDTMSEVIQILATQTSPTKTQLLVFGSFHNDISLVFLKLIYLLSSWRRMQWVPRPILFDSEGMLLSMTMFLGKLLKYFAMMCVNQLSDAQKEQHRVSDDMYNNLQILMQCARDPTNVDELDLTKLLGWFREVIEIENIIEEKWQEVLNGTLVYPWLAILCLPYEEIKQHGELNKWFVRYFKQYTRISRTVEDVIFPLLERAKISGNMDQYADSLLCFRDAEKLQPFFKRSQTRSIAYLSAKNQMQLGSVCPMVFRSTWIPYILSGLNHLEATSTVSPNIVSHRALYSHVAQPIPMQSMSPSHETVKSVVEPLHVNTTVAVDPSKSIEIVHSSPPALVVSTPHSLGLTPVHPVASELTTDTFLKDKATRASSSMVEGSHHSDIDNVDKVEDIGMRKSMEAMVEEPLIVPAASASSDTEKKDNVNSSASIKSNSSKPNVAPIDTAIIREQKERTGGDNAHKQQREEISPHGSEGERTAEILPNTSSSNGPNSSSTQPLYSPNPSAPAIVVNPLAEVVAEEQPVVEQSAEAVPPSASKSVTIEDTRVPLAASASTDIPTFSTPPNLSVQAAASDPSEPVEEPQLDSPPPNITSPPLDTTTKKARPSNKKTMIIKHVLSDDADDDEEEGEVVYLVRYDRHSSPDHNIINQIQQIQAAKKAGGASTSGSSSANILATPTASTPTVNPDEGSMLRQTSKNNNLLEEEEHFHRPRMSSDPSHSHSQHHPILLAQHRYSSPSSTSYRAPVVHGSPSWSHQHPTNHPRYETRARTYTDSYYSPPTSSASLLSSSTSTQRNWSAKNRLRGIDFSAQSLSTALRQIDEETQLQASASTPSLMPVEDTAVTAAAVAVTMEAKERRRAARKIATWYMIVAPRRKLLRRLLVRDTILGVISDVIDRTFQLIHVRQRRRQQLMRQGAAAKIQKHFRKWRLKLAAEERARELDERREAAWEYLEVWRRCVMNGIRLFRWFRTVVRRRMQTSGTSDSVSLGEAAPSALTSPVASKRASVEMPFAVSPIKEESGNTTNTSADTTPVDESKERRRSRIKKLRVSIMQNFVISPSTGFRVAIGDVIEMYIEEYVMFHKFGGFRRHSAPPVPIIHRNISSRTLVDIVYDKDDKTLHMRSYESYALCIQLAYRAYRARYAMWKRRVERQSTQKIILFLIRCMARRRRIRAELRRVSATKITKWFKGIRARMRLYDEVRCGLLLKLAWINYMHYKKLKSQLRRVDRPITILLHGLRNITKRALATDEIRIVVSVWWNPLLHIVGEADAEQMVQSKPPQYIYRSQIHRVTTEDDKPIPELAHNRRTLGTMVQRAGAFMNRISSSQNLRPRLTSAASSDGDGATPAIKEEDDDVSEQSAPVERQTLRNRRSANIHSGAPPTASPTAFVRKADKSNLAIAAAVGAAANRKRSSSGGSQDPPEHKGPAPASSSPPPPAGTKTTALTPTGTGGAPPSVEAPAAMTSPSQQFNPKAAALLANRIRQRRQSLSQVNGQAPGDDNASTATGGNTLGGTAGGDNGSIGTGGGHSASSGHAPPSAAAGGGLAAALAMRRQRLESNDETSHNNNDEEDDSTSDNPGFGQASRLTPTAQNVMRNTLAFAFGLSAMAKKSTVRKKSKVVCNFEDETIRIPGCHGNSVIKFEVFDGERLIGKHVFNMRKEGAMMYWGGEYQRPLSMSYTRRGVQLNSRIQLKKGAEHHMHGTGSKNGPDSMPVLDFRLIAGPPLRSRCQWGRVMVKGNGPLQRLLRHRQGFLMSTTINIFEHWERFYFSLDDVGLHLFENKFDQVPITTVLTRDFRSVTVDMGSAGQEEGSWQIPNMILKTLMPPNPAHGNGTPIVSATNVTTKFAEDIFNVVLLTSAGDEVNMRFPDAGSRIAWTEVLQNTIAYHHRMSTYTGGSSVSHGFAGISSTSSAALRWVSSAAMRSIQVGGSITGNGSTLIVAGGPPSSPQRGGSSYFPFSSSPSQKRGGGGGIGGGLFPIASGSSSPGGYMGSHSGGDYSLPPISGGGGGGGAARGRLGSDDSQGLIPSQASTPLFGNSPVVRQGKKYIVSSSSAAATGSPPTPAPASTPPAIVSANKRTPPIFSVPFRKPAARKASPDSSDSD